MIIGTFRMSSQGKSKQSRLSFDSDSDTEDDDDVQIVEKAIGWAYVGSHNFTPSAWGNLSGSAFNPVLNVCYSHRYAGDKN
jgi:tyrosyl-DNA phosphodiesterase-1